MIHTLLHTYRLLRIAVVILAVMLSCPAYAQKKSEKVDTTSFDLKARKKEVADSIRLVERGLKIERDSIGKMQTVKKDSLIEIQHALRLGVDIVSPLLPVLCDKDDSGWQVKADYRLTPRLYAAFDVGHHKRTKDFMKIKTKSEGMFFKAGIDYAIMRGIFDSDDMMYFGLKLGYSAYDRHVWGDTLRNSYWDNEVIAETKDSPSALWTELSVGVMVQVVKNVYLSMEGGYNMMLNSKKENGMGPLMVPGLGQVYNNSTAFSFSYSISYRIPLYKKTHRMRIKQEPMSEEEANRLESENRKEKEKLPPVFNANELIEQ